MELVAGMRVNVGSDASGSAVAVVRRFDENVIELDLLESFEAEDLIPGGALTVFAPHDGGLHCWPARLSGRPVDHHLALSLVGPSQMVQRRRHRRFEVDLEAEIRRVRSGRMSRPQPVRAIDLSHGGAKVIGTATLLTGDSVALDMHAGDVLLTAAGTVAMAYPDGAGQRIAHISFLTPEEPSPELGAIDRYLGFLEVAEATQIDLRDEPAIDRA